MDNIKKIGLLVQIARLYYEHGFSQSEIAQKLSLSRPYVSKLIAEAKEAGIVTIQINDPTKVETVLEQRLRQRFELRKVIVVPNTVNENALTKVGQMCSRYLSSITRSGDIIGVSWGATLMSCSQQAVPRYDLDNITVVQLCGGISNVERNIYATEIPKNLAEAFGGTPYILPLPAVLDDVRMKRTILRDRNIERVMEYANRVNIAVFTVGAFGSNSSLVHAGYLSEEKARALEAAGAVGDICTHIVDIQGNLCDKELDERTIAVSLEELKRKEYRIAVAIGEHKVDCICGALNGGYANALVTDERTAKNVMDRLDQLEKK